MPKYSAYSSLSPSDFTRCQLSFRFLANAYTRVFWNMAINRRVKCFSFFLFFFFLFFLFFGYGSSALSVRRLFFLSMHTSTRARKTRMKKKNENGLDLGLHASTWFFHDCLHARKQSTIERVMSYRSSSWRASPFHAQVVLTRQWWPVDIMLHQEEMSRKQQPFD